MAVTEWAGWVLGWISSKIFHTRKPTPRRGAAGTSLAFVHGSGTRLGVALLPFPLLLHFVTLYPCHHPCLGYLVFALLAVKEVFLEESRDVALVQQEGSEHP